MNQTAAQTHPRLVKIIEDASVIIEQIFAKSGHVAAMFHYWKDNGDHVVALAPVQLDKDSGLALMRSVLAIEEAVAVLFIDEAWSVISHDIEAIRAHMASGLGASDHPDRVEVVHFSAEDDTGTLCGMREIRRPPGKPPQLGPLEIEESRFSTGRLVGLLPKPNKATLQ